MKKVYIVSLVLTQVIAPKVLNGSHSGMPDISIQNEVGICRAQSPDEAYHIIGTRARIKYPDHKVAVRVVIETNEIDLNMTEE